MKKEILKTKSPLQVRKSELKAALLIFDLPTLIEKMKHKPTWDKGELNAKVLLKSPDIQIVLTALHEGTEIKSFQSHDSITFQIMEGELKFHTKKKSVILDKGQMITLSENIKYSIATNEETVLLLTIAGDPIPTAKSKLT